jgi:signal transduction histidine kinase
MENSASASGRFLSRLLWRILSFPIFLKIMGIGFLTAILFGSVTLIQTRIGTSRILSQLLEQQAMETAEILANSIGESEADFDASRISQNLEWAREIYPDMLYAVVTLGDGTAVSSTSSEGIPSEIISSAGPACPPDCGTRIVQSGEDKVYEARVPVLGGAAGSIRVGFLDRSVSQRTNTFTLTVVWGLLLCITLGALLALLLTYILTNPMRQLVDSANRIREGEFETRAEIHSNDEIGRLAVAFNQMAEALHRYQNEVQAKEKARVSLIERTVQVLEDERKSISRELHDHLGQSLTSLLLQVQSIRQKATPPEDAYRNVEQAIRQIIDEVRRLAWGMRPSILDDYGLDSALARHIEEVSQHLEMEIDYNYSSPPGLDRLPGRIEVCLFRIAQEAITNIQRHSGADHASVVVLRRAHDITMLIEDNGRGFNLSMLQEKRDKCLGLIGMKERVALLGGDMDIESIIDEGTTVRVRIHLDGDPNVNTHIDS